MKKPDSLREALLDGLPQLKANPDKLLLFVKGGKNIGQIDTLSYTQEYTLDVVIIEWGGAKEPIFIIINNWLQSNQSELLSPSDKAGEGYTFEAELLNHDLADIAISLKLKEGVAVSIQEDGQYEIKYRKEPSRLNIWGRQGG